MLVATVVENWHLRLAISPSITTIYRVKPCYPEPSSPLFINMEYFDTEAFEKVHCNDQPLALQDNNTISTDQLVRPHSDKFISTIANSTRKVDICKQMNIQDSAMLTLKQLARSIVSPDRREAIVRANPHFASIFGHRLVPASETTPNRTISPTVLSQKFNPTVERLREIFQQGLIKKDAKYEGALVELLENILLELP